LLLISHDLGVVAQHADRVAVMYAGRIVEQGPVGRVVRTPAHPYTRGLLASVPGGAAGSRLEAIAGVVPTPAHLGPGCAFAPRCAERFDRCEIEAPGTQTIAPAHEVRCHLHDPDRRRDAARESGRQAPGAEER
jgi:oligopeptide/dipeptide ABC transporter ATP-binding protein